ncbi:SpoIIIAH-like family protein [Paenibacillus eucommiae]|uniref:Stage III sporulation protein AH n=1 Tax=Paenibacillus eucommiae TaxID=1355755 RepID=A0ABS4INF6_9BACL|nr:SpoIIIAH-like family protein [Paenibacillus eucommiae]MBP1989045.1 stage III sporulation protein AH [Paenibacillus eucommiae]
MNAKRQTIWLVSMLTLMVVLSAYYLFTEDVSKIDLAVGETVANAPQEIKIDMSQTEQSAAVTGDGKAAETTAAAGETTAQTEPDTNTASSTGENATAKNEPTDEEILKKLESEQSQTTSSSDYFTMEQMKNHEALRQKADELLSTITDPKQKPEAVALANNELEKMSGEQEKIDRLEEVLLKDFPQAIVSQEGKKWKVTVQSEKLEKSQGVTIVDMVIKELEASPENIKIQYVKP